MENRKLKPMRGRDPHEVGRASSPLELLFDLTFAIAFNLAAGQLAHYVAEGHYTTGIFGFVGAMFAVCWAWVNFSWFASAYDTDDWIFRVATMVQMVGVLVLAMGLSPMFHSIENNGDLNNGVMILGFVIMRLALVFLWLRAAKHDEKRRKTCLTYAGYLFIVQLGWVGLYFLGLISTILVASFIALLVVDLFAPIFAEKKTEGTPWHAHHIAERFGLLAIIAMGEGVVGTVASVSAYVDRVGWSIEAILLCLTGIGLTFGMWWIYFFLPSGDALHKNRKKAYVWGYAHSLVFAAIAATGAGLHVIGYYIEGKAHISAFEAVAAVTIPVCCYIFSLYGLYMYLMPTSRPYIVKLALLTLLCLAASLLAAFYGLNIMACIGIVVLAPLVTVFAGEGVGYKKQMS